jgi:hypothetical protein
MSTFVYRTGRVPAGSTSAAADVLVATAARYLGIRAADPDMRVWLGGRPD